MWLSCDFVDVRCADAVTAACWNRRTKVLYLLPIKENLMPSKESLPVSMEGDGLANQVPVNPSRTLPCRQAKILAAVFGAFCGFLIALVLVGRTWEGTFLGRGGVASILHLQVKMPVEGEVPA